MGSVKGRAPPVELLRSEVHVDSMLHETRYGKETDCSLTRSPLV